MSTTNALYLPVGGKLVPLDLGDDTELLPTFQANDRTKPESIQSDYSPEFSVPGTAHNHRLLGQAAASQPAKGQAYVRLPCVLTSGGVETLPLGLLYVKGYQEGKYRLQLAGGNINFIAALGEKKLSDLNLDRFNHSWAPENVAERLPYDFFRQNRYGYELFDRGKSLDLKAVDPYDLYPSVAFGLVLEQIVADAGFTCDDLSSEPLYAALTIPAANVYEYPQAFRDARRLQAGYFYEADPVTRYYYYHTWTFAEEPLLFSYTSRSPYHQPEPGTTGATYFAGRYTADTLGYYDIKTSIPCLVGCNSKLAGKVRVKFMLKVNGQSVFAANGGELGKDEEDTGKDPEVRIFKPELTRYLLRPGDTVELWWQGTALPTGGLGPDQPRWGIGPWGSQTPLPDGQHILANEVQFTVTLLPDFPPGGLVRLADWLPDLKQLDLVKSAMLILGLTIQNDPYTNHLHLSPGNRLLAAVPRALDWTRKRDAYAPPGRLPERNLGFRFGSYGQLNTLKWETDERVTEGYGDGSLAVADEVLPATYELAKLPFAATEPSPDKPGLLRVLNFEGELQADGSTRYSKVEAKPRLTLRPATGAFEVQLIMVPAQGILGQSGYVPPVLQTVSTTASYFAGADLSLLLDDTVLTTYWADLRAMLDESRYLVERYRLTPQDIAELDYARPIWDAVLGDYFAVSQVSEYDARRSVEVTLCRLHASHLPPPALATGGVEFWEEEFYSEEYY